MIKTVLVIILGLCFFVSVKAQFISELIEYKPAPGQYVNSNPWGVPSSANSLLGTVTGSINLGSFGGYIIFAFESSVQNHADNPYGVDFTIFGNPTPTWCEPAIVSVMRDDNSNGLPDDIWYELAGSDYFFSSTIQNYEVTYVNPNQIEAADVSWFDNYDNEGSILANSYHLQVYYPLPDSFPEINQESYTLSGTYIIGNVDKSNVSNVKSKKRAFGYVDNQVRGVAPYTLPDNPYTADVENAGGDAFDINWAVNSEGDYVDLDKIDFVKIHNAMLDDAGWLGEISCEITGASISEPNAAIVGEMDLIVIKDLPDTIYTDNIQLEAFAFHQGRFDENMLIDWNVSETTASIDAQSVLHCNESGAITITAYLTSKPDVEQIASFYVDLTNNVETNVLDAVVSVYPLPASDALFISNVENVQIEILDATGKSLLFVENYSANEQIDIQDLSQGLYYVQIGLSSTSKVLQFIKL